MRKLGLIIIIIGLVPLIWAQEQRDPYDAHGTAVLLQRADNRHPGYSSSPGLDDPIREPCDYAYHDGTWSRAYYYLSEDDVMAEEFFAGDACEFDTYYVSHASVRVLTPEDYPPFGWPDPGRDPFRIGIWFDIDDDGYPDEPPMFIDTIESGAGDPCWVSVFPKPLLCMSYGRHFWVGVTNLDGSGQEGLCLDSVTDHPQYKWGRESGTWLRQDYYPGDHMIRVLMSGNRFPAITGPASASVDEGDVLSFEVSAEDPDGEAVSIRAENLPPGATFTSHNGQGSFEWVPGFCQSGMHYPRFVATDIGPPRLSATAEIPITVNNVNRPPGIVADSPFRWVAVGDTVRVDLLLSDADWLQCHDDTVSLTYAGPGVLLDHGDGHAAYTWVPEPGDTGSTTVWFTVMDSYGLTDETACEVYVYPYPLELELKRIYAYPGQEHVYLPVLLSNPFDSIGAFEVLVEYDITACRVVGVTARHSVYIPPISPDSGTYYAPSSYPPEYFDFDLQPGGHPNRIRVAGIMDMAWPPSFTPPIEPGVEQLLFCLICDVSGMWDGHVSLVGFRTFDCGDNALASPDGYTVWGPALEFASRETCPDRADSLRMIGLHRGILGVYEILVGDLNLNQIQYEIGDALVFVNYYIYGARTLVVPEIQGPASDVNGDGYWWTIGDLVTLINYMYDPPLLLPPLVEESVKVWLAEETGGELQLVVSSPTELGGAFIHIEYDRARVEIGAPQLGDGVNMTLATHIGEEEGRILVYSLEGNSIQTGERSLLRIPYAIGSEDDRVSDLVRFKETAFADSYGRDLTAVFSDATLGGGEEPFVLREGSPNPFRLHTQIAFTIPKASEISLKVYDSAGRLVRELFHGAMEKGTHSLEWNGMDAYERPLPSGVYFCVMDAEGFHQATKLTILR